MTKLKVQMKSKAQITKIRKGKSFDIEPFWHSFGIWILTFELFHYVWLDLAVGCASKPLKCYLFPFIR